MSGDAEPAFRSIGIVGLGLIGGSLALGLRQARPQVRVVGVDAPDIAAEAQRRGVVDETRPAAKDLGGVELVVLAAPVPDIVGLIADVNAAGLDALVTDVGSTKRGIMRAANAASIRFVGGHPIAGAAQGGLAYARADLFAGREWLVVADGANETDVQRLERLVAGLGARPHRIDAEAHDRLMAYVSHLPQIVASALMATAGTNVGAEGLAAAGPGFAGMTRLASSPADIWQGILASNADFVAEALQAFIAALPSTAAALSDRQQIERLFAQSNEWSVRSQMERRGFSPGESGRT